MTEASADTPAQRLARWTATDAAIGSAAEAEQLHAQLDERQREVADLRARLAQLASRVAQVEADNAELRRSARRAPPLSLAKTALSRIYRRLRSSVGSRLHR